MELLEEPENVIIHPSVYVDFRFDILENHFMCEPIAHVKIVDKFVSQYGEITHKMLGHEISHKVKKLHMHLRYKLTNNLKKIPSAFSQTFKYWFTKQLDLPELPPKGGHMAKCLREVKSENGFFQYCLKSIEDVFDIETHFFIGFTGDQITELWHKARENQRLTLERIEKENKKEEEQKLEYAKLEDYLDKKANHTKLQSGKPVEEYDDEEESILYSTTYKWMMYHLGTLILEYRKENHDCKIPTRNILENTIHRYCLKKGYLKSEDLAIILLKL